MKKFLFWFLAVIITLGSLVYQRRTGPTSPLRGKATIGDAVIHYRLPRSAENTSDCEVRIQVPVADITGYLEYKRFKTGDAWTKIPLERKESRLAAHLPSQPAAGKLAYRVILTKGREEAALPDRSSAIIRFRKPVPAPILILHVVVMFLALLFSTRAGLAALDRGSHPRKLALAAVLLLFIGGFLLGPLVQKFAFGPLWTGFPLSTDLTDNKTLIAMIGWIAAIVAGRKGKPARGWILGAAILLLLVYSIPHSLLGSELDYSKLNAPAVDRL
ncbi:MAG: hypothetical protein WCC06_03230 [Candidatus Aminicenantales bacterium]